MVSRKHNRKNNNKITKKKGKTQAGCMSNSQAKKIYKKEGDEAPRVRLQCRKRDLTVKGPNKYCWNQVYTRDLYENKRIIIFGLPGAFTPTCSTTHLPEYEKNYDKIKKLGIDEIYCLSVNDAFVMFNWCKKLKVKNVKVLPDGNGHFTKKMGLLVSKSNLGFGKRSWRYSMVIKDGIIEKIFIEKGLVDNCANDPFEVSDAKTMIKYLRHNK
jgi:peroxiredoxin